MEWLKVIEILAIVAGVWFTGWWLYSLYTKDASVIDIAWGPGFFLLALAYADRLVEPILPSKVITILVGIWGLRLAGHILLRKKGKPEDWRYQKMREKGGKNFWWLSYFKIFLLQATLMSVIALPIIFTAKHVNYDKEHLIYIGSTIWLVGFFFESMGDLQLSRFLNDSKNKGKIMTSGVWRYTRHPNYFGEITMWWGIWVIASTVDYAYITIASPLLITFLLTKVSGITMLEEKYKDNKDYQKYKKVTSALIPLPPRR